MMKHRKSESGAVSLFIVVFTALLITVITVSFIRLMVRDQQQATTVDLSQSAYDSAQAGIEDAKRAIIRYQTICASGDTAACIAARNQINSQECNAGLAEIVTLTDNEVKIQQNIGDQALDQAYTCVKINLETDDYLGVLQANSSNLIPLVSNQPFNRVLLEWYTSEDLQSTNSFEVDLEPSSSLTQPLLNQDLWEPNRPSLMRAQLMQVSKSGFRLSDFNDTNESGQSNTNTLFLYPSGTTAVTSSVIEQASFVGRDNRKTPTGEPLPVLCSGNLAGGGYACRVELVLPEPIGGGDRTAYLSLNALYNKTSYRLSLSNSGTLPAPRFSGVQPQVDSTGRANDLFRRVQSRVEVADFVDSSFAYPDAAVDITGNLCKDFAVTDNLADYTSSCTP